jgi:hypothetical protein
MEKTKRLKELETGMQRAIGKFLDERTEDALEEFCGILADESDMDVSINGTCKRALKATIKFKPKEKIEKK